MSEFLVDKPDYKSNMLKRQQKNPELQNILAESVFPISREQITEIEEIITKEYGDKRREKKPDLNKLLSNIGIKGELVEYSYNEESGKIVIASKLSKSQHTVYIIDTENNKIKNLGLDISFTGFPSWDLEFIVPGVGFIFSSYSLDDDSLIHVSANGETLSDFELGAYQYSVYDFDGNLLMKGKDWYNKQQSRHNKKNIDRIVKKLENKQNQNAGIK